MLPVVFIPIGSQWAPTTGIWIRTDRGGGPAYGAILPPTSAEISIQKVVYDKELRQYNEVEYVETLLRNQFINAFNQNYLEALRDNNDVINLPIHNIMAYLIRIYGQVLEEQYVIMEVKVRKLVYDPNLPVDVVFNKIDVFADVSRFTQRDISDRR